jgi:hypothetical protein
VKEIVNAVVSDNVEQVKTAYRNAAVGTKSVLQALELKARVKREIGGMGRACNSSRMRTGRCGRP